MFVDLSYIGDKNLTIGVAVSGGSDSMALLHYLFTQKDKYNYNVIAINIEHGIRGKDSISDSEFVKEYCNKLGVAIKSYSVDSLNYAKENKLSVEQSARILRYNCFYDAINNKLCDKIATAHHKRDNAESVLLNLFRGTGIKGLKGIMPNYKDFIIRPLLNTGKEEIEQYVKENNIPFVLDKSNLDDTFTRNNLRLNVLPKIKEIFPEYENSILRLSNLVHEEDEYLDQKAQERIIPDGKDYIIHLTTPPVLLKRAVIIILKKLGLEKDWEKVHVEDVYSLTTKQVGKFITLPKNLIAIRQENCIKIGKNLTKNLNKPIKEIFNFTLGEFSINNKTYKVEKSSLEECKSYLSNKNNGQKMLFADMDKIPQNAVIRTRKQGDFITPFGGGTRSLSDFLTDKKVDKTIRDIAPVIAVENEIFSMFGIEISNKIKITKITKNVVKLS